MLVIRPLLVELVYTQMWRLIIINPLKMFQYQMKEMDMRKNSGTLEDVDT